MWRSMNINGLNVRLDLSDWFSDKPILFLMIATNRHHSFSDQSSGMIVDDWDSIDRNKNIESTSATYASSGHHEIMILIKIEFVTRQLERIDAWNIDCDWSGPRTIAWHQSACLLKYGFGIRFDDLIGHCASFEMGIKVEINLNFLRLKVNLAVKKSLLLFIYFLLLFFYAYI